MLHPHRSRLIMPITNEKFVKKAPLRNADIIVLDLEDSIPPDRKIEARSYLQESINTVVQGGGAVYVRVNNTNELIWGDISSAVTSNLTGIYLPKVETADQVKRIEDHLEKIEKEKNLAIGAVQLALAIETAKGYVNLESILKSSNRIQSVTLGVEDFAEDLGMKINSNTNETLKNVRIQLCIIARAYNVLPMGMLTSISNYTNLDEIEKNARLAYEHGFVGSSCIHPSNVEVLNASYMPSFEEVEEAKQLVKIFKNALNEGAGAINYKGKMIDIAHYEKAKNILSEYEMHLKFEEKKKIAREQYISQFKEV